MLHVKTIRAEAASTAALISVDEDVDVASLQVFRRVLLAASQSHDWVIVSLENCPYLDATGLGALVATRNAIGSRLRIVVPSGSRINWLFDITGLAKSLCLVATITEAFDEPPLPSGNGRVA